MRRIRLLCGFERLNGPLSSCVGRQHRNNGRKDDFSHQCFWHARLQCNTPPYNVRFDYSAYRRRHTIAPMAEIRQQVSSAIVWHRT